MCSENNALGSITIDKFVREIWERTRQNRNRILVTTMLEWCRPYYAQ